MLSTEDDDEDEDETEQDQNQEQKTADDVEVLEKSTKGLSIDQDDNEEWETVGKK